MNSKGVGGAGAAPLDPVRLASASPEHPDHDALTRSLPNGEAPLLVPLVNGAATNMNLDDSDEEAQTALIERYLRLMGVAPAEPAAPSPATAPASPVAAPLGGQPGDRLLGFEPSSLPDATSDGGGTPHTDTIASPRPAQPPALMRLTPAPSALAALGLDRLTLSRRAIPSALISAVHRGLAANAGAFFRSWVAERRRLAVLAQASGPAVPLADRLLAFITGVEGQLKDGSSLPQMDEIRNAKDVQAILDAFSPGVPPAHEPFYHELVHSRQQKEQQAQQTQDPAEGASRAAALGIVSVRDDAELDALMDLDKITAMATAGNVAGLRALLRGLVGALDYSRVSLAGRLAAEGQRAQREWERATEARKAADRLREQLAARNILLAERGAELEAACRRATSAEEALVTERAVVAGLRGQLRQLTADYEAHHRELRAGLEAKVVVPDNLKPQSDGAPTDPEAGALELGAQVSALRSELALSELSRQQERAVGAQLRGMLSSVRGTVDMHAGRAAAAAAEVERLSRLLAASRDQAHASSGGMAVLEQQLAEERAAHRRTTERLQAVGWKVEQARTSVVDIRARAAHSMRKLQVALGDMNLRAVTAERRLGDASMTLTQTQRLLEDTTNSLEALRERSTRLDGDIESMRKQAVAADMAAKRAGEELHTAQEALKVAEARVAQLQQKVMDDADLVLAGKAALARLERLEQEHADLSCAHDSLRAAHEALSAAHSTLEDEAEGLRAQVAALLVKEAELVELTAKHEALVTRQKIQEMQMAEQARQNAQLTSELTNLKRHADVLETQCQEMREQVEATELDLEAEKDKHRHTKAELDITAQHRDALIGRCEELDGRIDKLEVQLSTANEEIGRCRRAVELAETQRAEAFAMRDAWTRVRLLVACDVREYLSAIEGQVKTMQAHLADLRGRMTDLQSRLLDMEPGVLEGTGVVLPAVAYDEAQKVCDSLFQVVSRADQLLGTQAVVRQALLDELEHVEDGLELRLCYTTEYWRQVLTLSRGSPKLMVQVVERMTGQLCRELELDPANPLARMVPIGVLEEAGVLLSSEHERLGGLRCSADEAKAAEQAAAQLLEHEREAGAARAAEYQGLVDSLSREVNRLKARVSSLEANNAMQQKATQDMQKMLSDAEWKVLKAEEREALVGIRNMVPLGRETKAVQTVHADLVVMQPASSLPLPLSLHLPLPLPGSAAATRPASPVQLTGRSHHSLTLSAATSLQLSPHPRSLPGEASAPEGAGSVRWAGLEGETSDGGSATASGWVAEALTSLPRLSAASSNGGAPGGQGAGSSWAVPGRGAMRSAASSIGSTSASAPASVARPQSNLSRASTALSPTPSGALLLDPGAGMADPAGAASTSAALSSSPGDGQRSPSGAQLPPAAAPTSDPGSSRTGSSGTGTGTGTGTGASPRSSLQLPSAPAAPQPQPTASPPAQQHHPQQPHQGQQQRKRRTQQGLHGGGGESSWLSSAPSVGSMPSAGSVGWEAAGGAAAAAGTGGEDGGGGSDRSQGEDEAEPPMVLRTPSTSATAAAAAAFAAYATANPHSYAHPHPHPHSAAPHRSGSSLLTSSSSAISLPSRPATASPTSFASPRISTANGGPRPSSSSPTHTGTGTGAAPAPGPPSQPPPATPSGIPHGWQHTPWDWLLDAAALTRGSAPYSGQALLELIADMYYTKGLHDQVAAAAAFPPTSMQQYIGAYFEARHGPRGGEPPVAEQALAQLLVSLEAHSALYEVMLFARVAGLQAWTGKDTKRRKGSAVSRPGTARSLAASAPAASGLTPRPATSRPGQHPLSPYAPSSGGGGLAPSSARAASGHPGSRVASGRNMRAVSARNGPPGMQPGLGLGLVPAPHGPALEAWGPQSPSGDTTLRLRTGLTPAVSFSSQTGAVSPYGTLPQQRQSARSGRRGGGGPLPAVVPASPSPPPARRPLRVRPEALVSEQLAGLLDRLGDVSGMEALAKFVRSGRLVGRLQAGDLGQPLQEEQHPELFFLVQRAVSAMGLEDMPELLVRDSLPYGANVMLLQLPNVATSSLGLLAEADVDRPPTPTQGGAPAAPAAPAGHWRRRAVLLLSPALLAAAPAAAGGGGGPLEYEEVLAMLGAALAPMAMPGGTGWRYDVQAGGTPASCSSSGSTPQAQSGAPPPAAPLLSAAEAVTTVNVAALKPRAAAAALPSQLQVKWERLLGHLRTVAAAATASADRGALLAAQSAAPAVRAVFRAAACGGGCAAGPGGLQDCLEGPLGSGEELLLQAQAMPWSEEELLSMAALPAQDVTSSSSETRRTHALARVLLLARWAESADYRQALRSAVM